MLGVKLTVICLGTLLFLVATTGAVGVQEATDQGVAVEIEASPTDWDEADATHAVVFTVGSEAGSAGEPPENLVIDYEPGEQPADASNVDPDAVQWTGVDRDGDDVGTRVDDEATVTEVDAEGDDHTLRVETAGDLQVSAGDEIVLVSREVQNPQDQGTPVDSDVSVTLNEEGADDVATDEVRYEYNDADVTVPDQETGRETVTVDSASLSEPGFVVLDQSGENPERSAAVRSSRRATTRTSGSISTRRWPTRRNCTPRSTWTPTVTGGSTTTAASSTGPSGTGTGTSRRPTPHE